MSVFMYGGEVGGELVDDQRIDNFKTRSGSLHDVSYIANRRYQALSDP